MVYIDPLNVMLIQSIDEMNACHSGASRAMHCILYELRIYIYEMLFGYNIFIAVETTPHINISSTAQSQTHKQCIEYKYTPFIRATTIDG